MIQSDARNVATDLTSLFTNLPTTSNATVSLNSDASTNIVLSGSVVVGVAGETATITLSSNVTLTKTGNTNPALGSGLKFSNTSNPTYACVISLPATVPYSWAVKLQPQCGTIVSEEGNLVPMNMATGTDTSNNASGIGGYVANSPGGVYSSTDRAYQGTHSIKVVHQSTRTDALVTGFQTLPAGCCPVPPSIAIPSGGGKYTLETVVFTPGGGRLLEVFVQYYNSSNVLLSSLSQARSTTGAAWETRTLVTDAPEQATKVGLLVRVYMPVVGETLYADSVGFWQGDGGLWAPPGVPVVKP